MKRVITKTRRIQTNNVMSHEEKSDFIKLIRKMSWLYEQTLNSLKKFLPSSNNLLDVACGDGYLLELIHSLYPSCNLYGLDVDPFFIDEARSKYDFQFEMSDVYSLEKKYEIITCNLALHHFENPVSLIRKLISCSTKTLIVSDQLRPVMKDDLENRLKKRKRFVRKKDVPFYEKNERGSILEAYSKDEIKKIFSEISKSGIKTSLLFSDSDYYERFVAIIEK